MTTPELVSEVIRFHSAIDGTEQAAGLCGPANVLDGEALPLIVELQPASILDLEATLDDGRHYLDQIGRPAVWVRPGGRGPGTLFQGYGAVDVFEAIAAAATRYPVDLDRVSLFGFSMGGAGVWYLATHFPDRFAAIAPLGGYNDFRLWKRPGGMTFPLMPWEAPSWHARSAIFQLENLRHTGIWMVHGAWDRAVGGGVDVRHARGAAESLDSLGIPYRYTELPATGHDRRFMREQSFAEVLRWLVEQRRADEPATVTLRSHGLHMNTSYWVTVQQQERYGTFADVRAQARDDGLTVETDNVRHLALRPPTIAAGAADLLVDGQAMTGVDLRAPISLRRELGGRWRVASADPPGGEKRPGQSGPFGALFERGTVLVRGTNGVDEETFYNEWCSRDAAKFFKDTNGGIHRGGIPGASWFDFPIVTDVDRLDAEATGGIDERNVIAYGTPTTNALLAEVADRLDVYADRGVVHVGDRTFSGEGLGLIAVVPLPDGSSRYLGIHGGTSPDAITSGAHLNWQLLPDYVVYDATDVLDWGFFDNEWKPVGGETA